jgi:Fic family protein
MKYADTDINELLFKKIQEKKKKLDKHRPIPKDALVKILEDIRLRHTYHSDAIEGNTLSLQETKVVLEEGVTISGKSLKDHIEAKDDAEAFDLMIELAQKKKQITQEIIQRIHETVTKGTLTDPGKYRTENVRISGSKTTPPSFLKIVKLIDDYIKDIKTLKMNTISKAAFIHHKIVWIHPFSNGNGRVARLLTNLYLIKEGYPPIVLKKEDRKKYYNLLKQADNGNLNPLTDFIAKEIHESLQYYLSILLEEERLIPLKEIAEYTNHSQEYLSLRARQGKLDAVKIENIWYSSKRAIKEYMKNK